jgi:hypothetical protein
VAKSILVSKTFWLNICALAVMLVQMLQGETWFDPTVQAAILAVANAGMRLLTGQPVTLSMPGTRTVIMLMLVCSLGLAGCAGKQGQAINAGEVLQQASGVMAAVANMQPAPVDAQTQAQMAGWQAWAQYLAPLVEAVGVTVAKTVVAVVL